MILELVKNVTLLISMCWMHGMLMRYLEGRKLAGDSERFFHGRVAVAEPVLHQMDT